MPRKPIIIMAGGTGGHIYPALAVAKYLLQKEVPLLWLGTTKGLEANIVPANGIRLLTISISGIRGKGIIKLVIAPFIILYALIQTIIIFIRNKPAAVLGMGGFASGPGGIAAWLMRIPLCIHEQNAIAGVTNKILSSLATFIMTAFPDTFPGHKKQKVTGNPVRSEILNVGNNPSMTRKRDNSTFHILVLGGSLGSRKLNELVPETIDVLAGEVDMEVYHQTGEKHFEATRQKYSSLNLDVRLSPFISDMADAYGWADVVICRAGAMTIAEIEIVGLASILVPYPYAVDDHQTANAEYLSRNGAAIICQENDLSVEFLTDIIKQLANDNEKLGLMSDRAKSLAKPEAVREVADICMEVAYG